MTIKEIAAELGISESRARHLLVCVMEKKQIKNKDLDYTQRGKYRCLNLSKHQAALIKAEHLRLRDNPANTKWTNQDYLDFIQVNFSNEAFSIKEASLLSGKTKCRIIIKLGELCALGLVHKIHIGPNTRYQIIEGATND